MVSEVALERRFGAIARRSPIKWKGYHRKISKGRKKLSDMEELGLVRSERSASTTTTRGDCLTIPVCLLGEQNEHTNNIRPLPPPFILRS